MKRRKNSAARACHPRIQARRLQQLNALGDLRIEPLGHWLQIVFAKGKRACSESADYSRFRIAPQLRRAKNLRGIQAGRRLEHHKARGRQVNGLQFFAHAFGPGVAAKEEERHVRAQLQADVRQRRAIQPLLPKAVERQQRRGGV